MRSFLIGICALAGLAADVAPASAAWNNVFQPTCFFHRRTNTTSGYYAPVVVSSSPVAAYSSPCTSCVPVSNALPDDFVQHELCPACYYQPVTTMESKTYYEPVTSYQTSYYYEPVTSYRYSCYYDPCSCGYKQVATPVTSYSLVPNAAPCKAGWRGA